MSVDHKTQPSHFKPRIYGDAIGEHYKNRGKVEAALSLVGLLLVSILLGLIGLGAVVVVLSAGRNLLVRPHEAA